MKTKSKIEGLYLWSVHVEYKGWTSRQTRSLWITTRSNSIAQVTKKTQRLINQNKPEWPKAKIEKIEQYGQLAA